MPTYEPAVTAPARPRSVEPVALADVAAQLEVAPDPAAGAVRVTGMALGAHRVQPGDLYAALPGAKTHGAKFAAAAAEAGARAILTDAEGAQLSAGLEIPRLVVDRPRSVLGSVAALVYGHPAEAITLIGVTGTQGKTTTTQLLNAGLAAAGRRTAVIGTMGTWIDGRPVKSALTTPEAPDLHALFAVMRELDVDVCAMEVSSHALVMGRVDGVVFDVAAFTNFGRDHLDFHTDVEEYFGAKAELFTPARARSALLNADDPYVARLVSAPAVPTHTFSPSGGAADWRAVDVAADEEGSTFGVVGPGRSQFAASVRLAGGFNVANALCAIAAVGEAGIDSEAAAGGVGGVGAVPGRMERVDNPLGITVIVDYAHKPDAVTATLNALRPVTRGTLTIVLGAGGDRDTGKRELMGEIAARIADVLVVTDDNPRSEDPAVIRAQVMAGARGPGAVREIGDRREAIATAVDDARPGDTVLIAGKGHETGQEVMGEVLPFDDRAVAAEALARRVESAPS